MEDSAFLIVAALALVGVAIFFMTRPDPSSGDISWGQAIDIAKKAAAAAGA